ncbi:MAG TPA: type II toxin-antitoxin system VapC family toxin [Candidatus Saccharimonadales bacterium]|nr:type II toxin-antitoxin system VapC family toxin [Candidatus Saccharimonadales bacterium]
MKQVVIDTNVLIYWYKTGFIPSNKDLTTIVPMFSIITKIEVLGFQHITNSEVKAINSMLFNGELVSISDNIVDQTISLRQNYKIKTPDAIIAATALVNSAELWTANTTDFSHIKGIQLFNPLAAGN